MSGMLREVTTEMNAVCPADFVLSEGFQRLYNCDCSRSRFRPEAVRNGDIVYCRHRWHDFFRNIHPQISASYILLSNFHDAELNELYVGVDDDRLLGWFANNVSVEHPKVHGIPRGIRQSAIRQLETAGDGAATRTELLYVNFHRTTAYRQEVWKYFESVPFATVRAYNKRDPGTYYADLYRSHFVISPAGYGEDCYRTWEALAAGAIPIVRTSFLDPLFADLPVLIVEDFRDVTEELLEKTRDEYTTRDFDTQQLRQSWWDERIRSAA